MPNDLQTTCEPDRIEAFLQQQLSAEEQSDFEAHLDECQDCRERLEASAASEELWAGVRESLSSQPLSMDLHDSTASDQTEFSHQTILDWLAPTDDDRMLGRLDGYEVMGVVGSGGMGVVLKALDPALNRYVAIKVLAPHLGTSGSARKRFLREAQASAAVIHENVIEIHGVSEKDGLPYLVMPYISGPSLQRRLDNEGPLELAEILRIGRQAATGLAAAHSQGLVHRDVKPANILLAEGVERVKLTDFGLARAADDASLTKSGVIAGTPQYMSPEQARGETIDQRSDLFSLGSVLYAMCTGRPPFRAETPYGVLRRITDDEPRPIREINPDIPEWLCQIIDRLMSKNPDDRFPSADEVAELLEQCLAHVQQPTAVPLPESLAPISTRKRYFSFNWTSWTALGVLGFGVLAALLWQSTSPPDIAGEWTGKGWGQVKLTQTGKGRYSGTYTDTYGPGDGQIELKWSRVDQRYRGTWGEGQPRFGKISVELKEGTVRGFWTTSNKSEIRPGEPEVQELVWVRDTGNSPSYDETLKFENPVDEYQRLIERRRYKDAVAVALKAKELTSDEDARQLWESRSKFANRLVKARDDSDEEQKLLELMNFSLQRIADARNAHTNSPPQPFEVLAAVAQSEKLPENSLNDLFKQHPENIRIIIEPVYDKVEEPRFYPLVGVARLHRVRFKCVLYFTETDELKWPGAGKGKRKIEKTVLIDHDHLIRADQKTLSENSNSTTFTPFDCLIVDSETGQPIHGKGFTIGLVFEIPKTKERPWQLVEEVLLGPGHAGNFKFEIPEKVLKHPDRDLIHVRWFVMHREWEQFGSYDPPRVNELINNDPRNARDGLQRIALRAIHPNSVQPEEFNEFTARVYILERLGSQRVGLASIRQLYENLLQQFPDHPDRAVAMYRLANWWENTSPAEGLEPDRGQSLVWRRKAVEASRPGTKLWFESRFMLQSRLTTAEPPRFEEAKQLLSEILDAHPDPVDEAKALSRLVKLALGENDEERGERICRQLHDRIRNEDLPKDREERSRVLKEIEESAGHLLRYWYYYQRDVPWSIREQKIQSFWKDYPFHQVSQTIARISAGTSGWQITIPEGIPYRVDEFDPTFRFRRPNLKEADPSRPVASQEIPVTPAEKGIARLVLVFYQDKSRREIPAVMIPAGDQTLVVTAAPAGVVPDGTPHAIDHFFLHLPGKKLMEARYLPQSTKELTLFQVDYALTDYRPMSPAELEKGDQLIAASTYVISDLASFPAQESHIVSLDAKADLNLEDRGIHHHFDNLIEIDGAYDEGTLVFKDFELQGVVLLGIRFLGKEAGKSYVVPVQRIAELCGKIQQPAPDASFFQPRPKLRTATQAVQRGTDLHNSREKVTVRFQVDDVRRKTFTDDKNKTSEQWELSLTETTRLTVRISPDAESALLKRGLDIRRHFTGKVIELVGVIEGTARDVPGLPDRDWTYHMNLESLDQIQYVKAHDFPQPPIERYIPIRSFTESKELIVSIHSLQFMLDFDTGETMDPPQVARPEQEQMDVHPGWDSLNPPKGLTGLSLKGLKVQPNDRDASPEKVQRLIARDGQQPLVQMHYDDRETATYFFQTKDGTIGILQLLALTDDPKGIRIRYKTLKNDFSPVPQPPVPFDNNGDGNEKPAGEPTDPGADVRPIIKQRNP